MNSDEGRVKSDMDMWRYLGIQSDADGFTIKGINDQLVVQYKNASLNSLIYWD